MIEARYGLMSIPLFETIKSVLRPAQSTNMEAESATKKLKIWTMIGKLTNGHKLHRFRPEGCH